MKTPKRSRNGIEVEERFQAVRERLKCEETEFVDIKLAVSPKDCTVQRLDQCSEFPTVTAQFTEDVHSLLRCRLCANPDNDMADIFEDYATGKRILEMIDSCLPIMVRESDTLPKQVCRICLEELERCYRFHTTVTKAERQLVAFERLASGNIEESDKNSDTFPLCERPCETIKCEIDRSWITPNDVEMSEDDLTAGPESAETTDMTLKSSALLSSLRPCSVVLSPIESYCTTNSEVETRRKIPSVSNTRVEADHKADPPIQKEAHAMEGIYKCTFCAKTFTTKGVLSKHNKLHIGKGLHDCEYCDKKFTSRSDRGRHHRIHTQDRPYRCTICEMAFSQLSTLKKHTSCHSSERNYACATCGKPFKSLIRRDTHMMVHIDEKPWECDYCKRSFKRKNSLKYHLTHCKNRPGPRQIYKCTSCLKMFNAKRNLAKHMRLTICVRLTT